jgi:hypothetical protein
MARCGFIKASGERCKGTATGPHGYCWAHDPANAKKRSRMASKAARSKPNRELQGVKAQLQELTKDVLTGDLETSRAAVANQLINTRLRAIEQERKIKETDELEARIEALEAKLAQPMKGARSW